MMSVFHDVDVVCQLAAIADVDYAREAPLETLDVNINGTAVVLEAARRLGHPRVILASTVWVYNACPVTEGPLDEDEPIAVSATGHVYTTSKLAAEMIAHTYADQFSLPVTILRFGIPYGPGMREHSVIPVFVRAVLEGREISLHSDGRQMRQFVDVRDLCAGVSCAIRGRPAARTFNLVGPEPVSIRELAHLVMEVLGRQVPLRCDAGRPGDLATSSVISGARAARDLGWRPTIPLAEGIRHYADSTRSG
jgi:UDP-glucose 4-epimerase